MFGKDKRCIVCGGSGGGDGQYVRYRIFSDSNKTVGRMDVHRNMGCFTAGSKILRMQQEQAIDASYIESANVVDGKKYTYVLARKSNYFVIPLYVASHGSKGAKYELRKDTYKFLQNFIRSDSLVLAYMRALNDTPEARIPLLASTHDAFVPASLIEGDDYRKRKLTALHQMRTSVNIRGNDRIQEAQIMHQYLQDTAILL